MFLTPEEKHQVATTENDTAVVNTVVEENDEGEAVLVERLVGVVRGETIGEPKGAITRTDGEDATERVLRPSGGRKVEFSQLCPDRANWPEYRGDRHEVREK